MAEVELIDDTRSPRDFDPEMLTVLKFDPFKLRDDYKFYLTFSSVKP